MSENGQVATLRNESRLHGVDDGAEGAEAAPPPKKKAKTVAVALLALVTLVAGVRAIVTRGRESTDDAQVEGRVVPVNAQTSGQVLRVLADDNQLVKAGDVLVEIDRADAEARVEVAKADVDAAVASQAAAEARLAFTERQTTASLRQAKGGVTQANSGQASARAALAQARADISLATARRKLAETELKRAERLHETSAVSIAELETKQALFDEADAQLEVAKAKLANAQAGTGSSQGVAMTANARMLEAETADSQVSGASAAVSLARAKVRQARAALALAQLNLAHTTVKAPIAGVVSKRTVEAGQMIAPDRPLLALIPVGETWVVANLKETQLERVRAGQRAEVTVDAFGSRTFVGRVESIAAATGARFSLIPADNGSGNFIKVVQRVPIKIRLDSAAPPELRPGMSALVTIFTKGS
jgi:membrane fusion protein (multidrug efflux system)